MQFTDLLLFSGWHDSRLSPHQFTLKGGNDEKC